MSCRLMTWVVLLMGASVCLAQDPNYAELKKSYDDALKQLEMAQQRKNELAQENERLAAWKKEAEKRIRELEARARQWATETYLLRMEQAAWRDFLSRHPTLKAQWDAFLEAAILDLPHAMPLVWEKPPVAPPPTQPATRPQTLPATQPATRPATEPDTPPTTQPATIPATQS